MGCYSVTAPATPTGSHQKASRWRCSSCSSTSGYADLSPTAASITAPTSLTSRQANAKPPTTAPTKPFNRSSICLPPDALLRFLDSSSLSFSGLESTRRNTRPPPKTLADAKNLYWARQVDIERMMASGWRVWSLGHDDEAVALMQDA